MPPHISILDTEGAPATPITVSISGGEESAVTTLEIWNDKDADEIDTTTSRDQLLKILTSSVIGYVDDVPMYGPWATEGVPLLNERWPRVRITHTLTADGESTEGATGTLPLGVNSDFPLPDLDPQTGVRIEFYVVAPAGQTADKTKIKLSVVGDQSSAPLAKFVTLATGSGVVPPDRIPGLRSLVRGSVVTADDTATVSVSGGLLAYEGTDYAFAAEDVTFTLADGDAVDLDTGEAYLVTLSRTPLGALVATKGPKAEALEYPAVPDGNVYVERLTVSSADGIAVAVAPSSLQGGMRYAAYAVRRGTGLNVIVSAGDGVTSNDQRQYLSHEIIAAVTASSVNRVWRVFGGGITVTLTDAEPSIGADLLALVTTDTDDVTVVADARRFLHRAVTTWVERFAYVGVLSTLAEPSELVAWQILDDDAELEDVSLDLSALSEDWTAGTLRIDIRAIAPGVQIGDAGASIYTADAQRPALAWDAATLRVVSEDHITRRFLRGTRFVLDVLTTFDAPAPEAEQEIRVTMRFRRYR